MSCQNCGSGMTLDSMFSVAEKGLAVFGNQHDF
jgi:hypothetical protein